jgi:hypothetical protein
MKLRVVATAGLAIGVLGASSAFASYARVESMGKNTTYIMDDVSIFDNPANINLYPNYLIGEMGEFLDNDLKAGSNKDPQNPWFGGIFSLALGSEDSRDPRLSIAGAFNRVDKKLFRFLPDYVLVEQEGRMVPVAVPAPVTNFDGFLGGTLPNGNALGVHVYTAIQDGADVNDNGDYEVNADAFASVFKADVGVNWQFSSSIDGEIALGGARIQYGPEHRKIFDGDLMSIMGSARLFSTIEAINGELVPAGSFSFMQAPGIDEMRVQGGVGVNVALDRGFFWLGVDYVGSEMRTHNWTFTDDGVSTFNTEEGETFRDVRSEKGGVISFGIERNIWWDWFVMRVGGQKAITYVKCNHNDDPENPIVNNSVESSLCKEDGNYFTTNPVGDGSTNDHVGFGIGVNVEEKLKVDATLAEDILYRNPFQGSGRLISRVSATYSF